MADSKFQLRPPIKCIDDIDIYYISNGYGYSQLERHPGIYKTAADVFGYKKVRCIVYSKKTQNAITEYHCVMKLRIPCSSTIIVGTNNLEKMRTNQVYVEKTMCDKHDINEKKALSREYGSCNCNQKYNHREEYDKRYFSMFNSDFEYFFNKLIVPTTFNKSDIVCSSGIHFFATLKKAQSFSI